MEKNTLLFGEPMGLLISQETGAFEDVSGYYVTTCGAEFNVAIGMTRLEHKVGFYTKLGDDPFGKRIVKMMNKEHISTELIEFIPDRFTGFMLKSKVLKGDPDIFYFRKNSAASTISPEDIDKLDLSSYDAIHMTGITPAISSSARAATLRLYEKARERGMFFTFDPNIRVQLWPDKEEMKSFMNGMAAKCDIFFPGIKEAKMLTGLEEPEEIAQMYRSIGSKCVIIKMGSKGAYFSTENDSGYVPGFKAEKVVDTVGAGDGFAAGVLTGLKEGLSLRDSIKRGNAVGCIQVMSLGDNDGLPTRKELEDFMAGKPDWRK
jgi:2-dehydro-3-deoxygluconokinase